MHFIKGLSKYPQRALHLSSSDARFGRVHFSGPPRFCPLGTFFGFFFCYIRGLRPQVTLGSFLWDQVRPHSIKKIGGGFYPTHATPSRTWPPSHAQWGFLGTSLYKSPALCYGDWFIVSSPFLTKSTTWKREILSTGCFQLIANGWENKWLLSEADKELARSWEMRKAQNRTCCNNGHGILTQQLQ